MGTYDKDLDRIMRPFQHEGRPTPYDTGARLEPKPWSIRSGGITPSMPEDDYGKVDFENDESATEMTIHVERTEAGVYKVVIEQHCDTPISVIVT